MRRRLAAGLLAAATLFGGSAALAPAADAYVGTCDPASRGMTYNEGVYAVDNGAVVVTYRFGWDGVSQIGTEEGCIGPILYLSGTSHSATVTYYAHFQGRKGNWRIVQLGPGQTRTFNKTNQLHNAGFDDNTDVEGMTINTDPRVTPAG